MKIKLVLLLAVVTVLFYSSCGGNKQGSEADNQGHDIEKQDGETEQPGNLEISIEKETYKPAEKVALTVLKAYADQDLEMLKSFASGAQKMALDDTYFTENGNAKGFIEKIANWEGAFKDIRYYEDNINFEHVYYAVAAFYESPSGQITAVELKSTDKESWKMSGFGTKYIKKEEFEALSTGLPE